MDGPTAVGLGALCWFLIPAVMSSAAHGSPWGGSILSPSLWKRKRRLREEGVVVKTTKL